MCFFLGIINKNWWCSMEAKKIDKDLEWLKQVSREVDLSTDDISEDLKILEEYCLSHGVFAMAAVQLGISKRLVYIKNTDLDKILDVNIYIMLSRYAQENEEVGYSLRDMYVDDMIKYAMLYRDEERPTSAIGVTYDLRKGPEHFATKSLKRNVQEYTRDARIKNYAKACGEKRIGFAEVIETPNPLKNKFREIIDSRKPKMSIAEKTVLKYHQKQDRIEARAAARAKRRPIYQKQQEDNER